MNNDNNQNNENSWDSLMYFIKLFLNLSFKVWTLMRNWRIHVVCNVIKLTPPCWYITKSKTLEKLKQNYDSNTSAKTENAWNNQIQIFSICMDMCGLGTCLHISFRTTFMKYGERTADLTSLLLLCYYKLQDRHLGTVEFIIDNWWLQLDSSFHWTPWYLEIFQRKILIKVCFSRL